MIWRYYITFYCKVPRLVRVDSVTNGAVSIQKCNIVLISDWNLIRDYELIRMSALSGYFVVFPSRVAFCDHPDGKFVLVNIVAAP